MNKIILIVNIIILFIFFIPFIYFTFYFIYKYILPNINRKINKYLKDWIIITGPSSGIGLAILNKLLNIYKPIKICLIGRNLNNLKKDIISKYNNNVKIKVFNTDFANSQNEDFFLEIDEWINKNNVSLLINNVGHRSVAENFIKQERQDIIETINCGTMPQIRLTQKIMEKFNTNFSNTYIINITAQCFTYNTGLGLMYKPTISVPYLAVYEATNAFGYYLAESIFAEIKILRRTNNRWNKLKFLNITPGAVLTDKTKNALAWIPFSCSDKQFANGIIRLINQELEGQQCAHWSHELSNIMMFLTPFLKSLILEMVGKQFTVL